MSGFGCGRNLRRKGPAPETAAVRKIWSGWRPMPAPKSSQTRARRAAGDGERRHRDHEETVGYGPGSLQRPQCPKGQGHASREPQSSGRGPGRGCARGCKRRVDTTSAEALHGNQSWWHFLFFPSFFPTAVAQPCQLLMLLSSLQSIPKPQVVPAVAAATRLPCLPLNPGFAADRSASRVHENAKASSG